MRIKLLDVGSLTTVIGYISFEAFNSLIALIITIAVGIPTALLKWREWKKAHEEDSVKKQNPS
jgi:membrane protein YdbS with pleckstrin-like domain